MKPELKTRIGDPLPSSSTATQSELDLLDILALLWRGKWIVFSSVITFIILSYVYINSYVDSWTSTAIVSAPSVATLTNYSNMYSFLSKRTSSEKIEPEDLQRQLFQNFIMTLASTQGMNCVQGKPGLLNIVETNKDVNFAIATKDDESKNKFSFPPLSVSCTTQGTAEQSQLALYEAITKADQHVVANAINDMKTAIEVNKHELSIEIEMQRQREDKKNLLKLKKFKHALTVADDANISKPSLSSAEGLSEDNLFLLGSDALKSIIQNWSTRPTELDREYLDKQALLLLLNNLNPDLMKFKTFFYVSQPNLPVYHEKKMKPVKIFIAFVLGLAVGSAIVLGRATIVHYRRRQSLL